MAQKREFKKINPFTASLEELEESLRLANNDHDNCQRMKCDDCASSASCVIDEMCFGVETKGLQCAGVRFLLAVMIAQKKKNTPEITGTQNPSCNGCCDSCKWLDSELLKKSGYRFCQHWHNFTISDGFCYAYEGVENREEPVDN